MPQVKTLFKATEPARYNMVECQLRPDGIVDRALIERFESVHREDFVPLEVRSLVYSDTHIPLLLQDDFQSQRWLLSPLTLGRLLQAAALQPVHNVLIAGCATGYSLALVSPLVAQVVGLEIHPVLAANARRHGHSGEFCNTILATAPLDTGCPSHAPYDIIIIEGAVASVPECFSEQLSATGRLVTVLKAINQPGQGVIMENRGNRLTVTQTFEANCPWLAGFASQRKFKL